MKRLSGVLVLSCMVVGLSACSQGETTPSPNPVTSTGVASNDPFDNPGVHYEMCPENDRIIQVVASKFPEVFSYAQGANPVEPGVLHLVSSATNEDKAAVEKLIAEQKPSVRTFTVATDGKVPFSQRDKEFTTLVSKLQDRFGRGRVAGYGPYYDRGMVLVKGMDVEPVQRAVSDLGGSVNVSLEDKAGCLS